MDELVAEDSGQCEGCGKAFKIGDYFVQDEYDDNITQWHVSCWNASEPKITFDEFVKRYGKP